MSKKRTAVLEDLLDGLVESRAPTSQARRKVRNEEKAIRAAIGEAKRKQKIQLEEDFMPLEEKRKLKRIANIMKRVLKRVKENSKKGKKYKVADIDQVVRLAKDNELLDEDAEAIAKMIQNIPYMSSSNTLFQKGKAESKLNDALNNLFVEAEEIENLPKDVIDLENDLTVDQLKNFLKERGVSDGTMTGLSKAQLNSMATRLVNVRQKAKNTQIVPLLEKLTKQKIKRNTLKRLGTQTGKVKLKRDVIDKRMDALSDILTTRATSRLPVLQEKLKALLGDTYDGIPIDDLDYHDAQSLLQNIKTGRRSGIDSSKRYIYLNRIRFNDTKKEIERLRNMGPPGTPLKERLRRAKERKQAPELRRQSALSKAIEEAAEQMERLEEPTDGTLTQRGPDGELERRPEGSAGEDFGKGGEAAARAARAAQEREEQEQEAAQEAAVSLVRRSQPSSGSSGASEGKTGDKGEDGNTVAGSVGLSKRLDTLISWLDSRLRSL